MVLLNKHSLYSGNMYVPINERMVLLNKHSLYSGNMYVPINERTENLYLSHERRVLR